MCLETWNVDRSPDSAEAEMRGGKKKTDENKADANLGQSLFIHRYLI